VTTHLIDPSKAAYVVVDTETTGLDWTTDAILEVGVTIVDRWLSPLAVNSWLVAPEGWEDAFATASDLVRKMHVENGLAAEVRALPEGYEFIHHRLGKQYGDYSPTFVSLAIWEWLTEICGLEAGKFPMTGSSVAFDRDFWAADLSVAHEFFTYRNADVSAIKEVCRQANPGLFAEMQLMPQFQKANAKHRVRDDMMATLRELTFYYENFLNCSIPEDVSSMDPLPGLDV